MMSFVETKVCKIVPEMTKLRFKFSEEDPLSLSANFPSVFPDRDQDLDLIRTLLRHGADPDFYHVHDQSLLDVALEECPEIAKVYAPPK